MVTGEWYGIENTPWEAVISSMYVPIWMFKGTPKALGVGDALHRVGCFGVFE